MTDVGRPGPIANVARWLLAGVFVVAGFGHFLSADAFTAQVPPWLPFPAAIVAISGVIEFALAGCLLALPRWRTEIGWIVAAFFVAVFPGNISQFVTQSDAFGLDSDLSRAIRLIFQPLLVVWAMLDGIVWQV